MRTTKNVTVAISKENYRRARVWAARCDSSLSAAIAFLIENLEDIAGTLRYLRKETPGWGENGIRRKADSARETVKPPPKD